MSSECTAARSIRNHVVVDGCEPFWGILGALVMRGGLIYLGVTLIEAFHWIVFLFGAFLIASGVKMILAANAEPDLEKSRIVRFMRRRFRVTEGYSFADQDPGQDDSRGRSG